MLKKIKTLEDKIKKADRKANEIAQKAAKVYKTAKKVGKVGAAVYRGDPIGAFKAITGSGDYNVQQNSIMTKSVRYAGDVVPSFQRAQHGVRVQHREYIGEVIASSTAGAFSVRSYALNPGLFSTFPWLSAFANQFDEWKPNGVVVCFKSTSSFYSGTTQLGAVMIASDYDVLDTAYSSKLEMENSEWCVSASAAQSIMHPVECRITERPSQLLYTRSGDVASTDNLRFYDLCNVQVATQGCVASQVCGELWLSYDITFYKPQLYGGILGRSQLFSLWTGSSSSVGSNISTGMTLDPQSSVQDITLFGSTLTFPEKYAGATWHVMMCVTGTAATTTYSTWTVTGGLTSATFGGSITAISGTGAASQNSWNYQDTFSQAASPGTASTLTYGSVTWPSTPTQVILYVTQVNPALIA
jgi:hypothetical protein